MTHDTWFGVNIILQFQLSSSNGLGVMMFRRFGGKGSLIQSVSDEAVCRTAPATPGLLKTVSQPYLSSTSRRMAHQITSDTSEQFAKRGLENSRLHYPIIWSHVCGVLCVLSVQPGQQQRL